MANAKNDSFDTIYQIGEAINGIEKAKMGNSIIKKRVEDFNAFATENLEELAMSYSWKPNLEF